jgi:hypothetical protein
VGEWTGDSNTQAEGAAQQIKGKAQKAWGNVKEAAHDAKTDLEHEQARTHESVEEHKSESEHKHVGHNH